MTGINKEKEVLAGGNQEMWDKQWSYDETFFKTFKNPCVLDLPGYSYDLKVHEKSRLLLKKFFLVNSPEEKEAIRKEYNQDAFVHHRAIKTAFFEALQSNHDFVLGYFSVADVIGHLNFGNTLMMRMIYSDLEEIASKIMVKKCIILSDHGMYGVGMFGDHSSYGFWSTNFRDLGLPRITDFRSIIEELNNVEIK